MVVDELSTCTLHLFIRNLSKELISFKVIYSYYIHNKPDPDTDLVGKIAKKQGGVRFC